MVFGHPGHVGRNVAKTVVGELHEEPGLAMVRHVVEMFALGTIMKARLAMSNAVVSIIPFIGNEFLLLILADIGRPAGRP